MNHYSILLLAIALSGVGCSGTGSAVAAENGFRFSSPNLQKSFASALQEAHVHFRQLEDGTVVYSATQEEKVMRIRNSVLESSFKPSYRFEDDALRASFAERLKSQGIKFGVETREGKTWITWAEADDAKVRQIGDEIINQSVRGR
jgi:hypothetical protein